MAGIDMDVLSLDAPVRTLFELVAGPAAAPTPELDRIGAALAELARNGAYLERWIERLGETSGAVPVHAPRRGPRLMLVHRLRGQMGAVHDHSTWVALAPVTGIETHRRYRVRDQGSGARPELVEARHVAPSDSVTLLPPDDLHDHGHLLGVGDPAHVLIMTGDDQAVFARNEWDLATGLHRILQPGDRGRWLASESFPRG